MADIELVIKIDEKLYETSKTLPDYMCGAYQKAIINGKPLPKEYGRLIDISEYENNYFNVSISYDDGNHIYEIYTREIPSIIEADNTCSTCAHSDETDGSNCYECVKGKSKYEADKGES